MIRPCSECSGTGCRSAGAEWMYVQKDCSLCGEMPKLGWPYIADPHAVEPSDLEVEVLKRGWFKPDPDSILRWCFEHEAWFNPDHPSADFEGQLWCMAILSKRHYAPKAKNPCDIGWIAKPTRLETIE